VIGFGFTVAGLNAEQRTVASGDTLKLLGVT
jgi:hypothetical protein